MMVIFVLLGALLAVRPLLALTVVIGQVGRFTKPNGLLSARVRRESDATPERKSFLEFFPEEGEREKGGER